ncbi:MAG: PCRF domain-containing protein, partial [Novosphingobium sp.]|nr:PCRF domain-containing protein [Novosphingobium sp.]
MTISDERLAQIASRFAQLEARLASGMLEGEAFVAASRDYAELEPVARVAGLVAAKREELRALTDLLALPDFKAMAEEELATIRAQLPELERQLA